MGQEAEVKEGRDPDMTGAELRLIREQCGMTLAEFGDIVGVVDKSVRGWETAEDMRVPLDVAEKARSMHISLMDQKTRILADYQNASPGDEVVINLLRKSSWEQSPEFVAIHNAAAGLAFHELVDDGISVWVQWDK